MKSKSFLPLIALLLCVSPLFGQVVDRYPVIQCPTETSVLIAWRTAAPGVGTLSWGTDSLNLTQTQSDPVPTQKHAYTIENLNPNTRYYYQVTSSAGFTSDVEAFYTSKPVQVESVSFLHYGDCGYNNQVQNDIAALMEQESVDFAVVAGDVDQGDGSDYDDIFFGVYKDMLARECHYTAIGNHDLIYDNGATYLDAFYLPNNNAQGTELYYSFSWGHTKFIALDSNGDYSPGSPQHNFMLDELKCRDHQWVFVFFHHPPWTNAWDPLYYVPLQPYYEYDGNDDMRSHLVPYFEQYDVDFVLNGHSHCYQRGDMNGVHYVISGGAGSTVLDQHTCNTFPAYNACAPNLSVEIYENHYVRFEVHGDTATYYTVNISGQLIDSVQVIKSWTPYQATVTSTDESGPGMLDGTATAAATGPNGPYSYAWSNGGTTGAINGLAAGTYYVTISDAFGCERVDSALVGGLVQLDPLALSGIQVLPNPFQNQLRLQWEGYGAYEVELLNLQGQVVLRQKGSGLGVVLETSALAAGAYVYRLKAAEQEVQGKVLKW